MINEEYGVCLSQELHAFLLDEIYEDMNRDKNKPYIKSKVADGRPDEEVADEYWANHIARNDLIIVDVSLGQYKSTLVSPACEKISVTFDPFMHLSLPLQSTTTRKMSVTIFSCDRSVVVLKQGRVRDFIQAFSSTCALKQNEKVFIVEIRNHLIQHLLEDPLMSLSSIKDDDHFSAYKIPMSIDENLFRFNPLVAPIQCTIFSLFPDQQYVEVAKQFNHLLTAARISDVVYPCDNSTIQQKYTRIDENGVAFNVTVVSTSSVLILERDTQEQNFVSVEEVATVVKELSHNRGKNIILSMGSHKEEPEEDFHVINQYYHELTFAKPENQTYIDWESKLRIASSGTKRRSEKSRVKTKEYEYTSSPAILSRDS
ncbi:ubiquitin carboxyl-terminal hydrolase 5 [Tanacetum coccineum]